MTERRALRADARRNVEKLLDAARAVFRDRGLGAPLEAVATHAGVSIGTLYNRFPTRQDLIDAALPELLGESISVLSERALAAASAWDRFAAYVLGLSELQARDHAFSDAMCHSRHASPAVEQICHAGLSLGARLIAEAQAEGALRDDVTVDDVFTALWLNAKLAECGGAEGGVVAQRQMALLLDGMRAESADGSLPGDATAASAVANNLMCL
ncbi:TetR/AcrR family transcriptional regulator [Mycobacterium sp. NPDC003323]